MKTRLSPEPVQVIKKRRDEALRQLVAAIPYINFLGVEFDRRGDELTAILPFKESLIGDASVPALHGGATAAFMEITAIVGLSWSTLWPDFETGKVALDGLPPTPKTIDITMDYLRPGLPRDAYARAKITRSGRRYASVFVEAWQDNRLRPIAQATGHFLMPEPADLAG
ncbi:PaaI family thioesterase [Thioclava sp. GXIMD4216]|uniref:PaaI family thioesterase n=1 Tax=Thioclava litoralis TaxID=3076557 RepID=A0ABZ1E018_9RHOB|nr:PaaI family thioesterase [Thioclava sp. FTW29]